MGDISGFKYGRSLSTVCGFWQLKSFRFLDGCSIPIVVLMALFSVRCFSLMHDCGHYSLFSSKKVNSCVGFWARNYQCNSPYAWASAIMLITTKLMVIGSDIGG